MFFLDTHCHINSEPLRADAQAIVLRAKTAGVRRILAVGSDLENSREAVRLARSLRPGGVFAAVGVHPHDSKTVASGLPEDLLCLPEDFPEEVVAVGETGLDYYYDHSPREVQRDVFSLHAMWARRIKRPLIIHVRDAVEDALAVLKSLPFDVRELKLLFHCYAGGLEYLDAVEELDAYLSVGGPVTWDKNAALRETAARIPEDRLLLETDAPWLTPKPYRGKINEPAYVRFVYEAVATARGVSCEHLAKVTDVNADRLFGWGRVHV